jgi:hypothetical protein
MQMAVDFSFGQVEAVCAAMQDIASDKRPAFTSRLKHLMKSGIVDEERRGGQFRPGRGKAAKFSYAQLMKFVIGVELLQAGTPPALAAKLVQGNWLQLRVGVYFALYNEVEKRAAGDPREETFWVLGPEALRDLTNSGESDWDHYEAFESIYRTEDLAGHLAGHATSGLRGHYRRQLVLNGTAITRSAAFLISFEMHIATIDELRDDLLRDIREDEARLEKAMKEIDLSVSLAESKEKRQHTPYFRDFEERMNARVQIVVNHLTDSQMAIMTAQQGSQVELMPEDLLHLRKLDLIGVQQGEIVITELGQYVADELRRQAGARSTSTPTQTRRLERAAQTIKRMADSGLLSSEEAHEKPEEVKTSKPGKRRSKKHGDR